MKNFFKLGFLALAISLSLSACEFFSSSRTKSPIDSNNVDSAQIDSTQLDKNLVDSTKRKVDSTAQTK